MVMKESAVAVVTGAARREGIGFEVCRQLALRGMKVVLTGRDLRAVDARVDELRKLGADASGVRLDVADAESVATFGKSMALVFSSVDVLVNNAAGPGTPGELPSTAELTNTRAVLEATVLGSWRVTQVLLPLLRKSERPRIVNVSSGAGSHGDARFGLHSASAMGPTYAVAKAALNALTATLAAELGQGIRVNAVCPGLTATFPGAEQLGARPVAEGAASVVWAATLEDDGPTGGFFRDGKPLPW